MHDKKPAILWANGVIGDVDAAITEINIADVSIVVEYEEWVEFDCVWCQALFAIWIQPMSWFLLTVLGGGGVKCLGKIFFC